MSGHLSPQTVEHIRALCRQISVSHNLDEEIQRELYSHMEDKLLGYLSGAEKVTEDDALILVREHFGKPEAVREMFHEVHAAAHLHSFRALGAFIAALLGSVIVCSAATALIFVAFRFFTPGHMVSDYTRILLGIPAQGMVLLLFCITLWSILLKWKREMNRGLQSWFSRIRGYNLLGILILLSFGVVFINAFCQRMIELAGMGGPASPDATAPILHDLQNRIAMRFDILLYLSIIWWFDRLPKRPFIFQEGVWLSLFLSIVTTMIRTSPEMYARTIFNRLMGTELLNLGIAVGLYSIYVAFRYTRERNELKPFLS